MRIEIQCLNYDADRRLNTNTSGTAKTHLPQVHQVELGLLQFLAELPGRQVVAIFDQVDLK